MSTFNRTMNHVPAIDYSYNGSTRWETYDPRIEQFCDPTNTYARGPGSFLPKEQQPYNIRRSNLPFKLFVCGIHPRCNEEGLTNMFASFGKPLNVTRGRNRNSEPIGFVEFSTQSEADSAIIGLNDKAPLFWRVTYAIKRSDDHLFEQHAGNPLPKSEIDEQILLFDPQVSPRNLGQLQQITNEPIVENTRTHLECSEEYERSEYSPCVVCNLEACLVCAVCKTRYCSSSCQSSDWPRHKEKCSPPPALEMAEKPAPRHSSSNTISPARVKIVSNSSQVYNIQGIQPLDHRLVKSNEMSRNVKQGESIYSANKPLDYHGSIQQVESNQQSFRFNQVNKLINDQNKQRFNTSPGNTSSQVSPRDNGPHSFVSTPSPKVYATTYRVRPVDAPTSGPMNVVVCFCKSPDKFYFQLESIQPYLKKLHSKIQDAARTAERLLEPRVGCPCLAVFDGAWYRGEVILYDGSENVGVRFVDYGNTAKIANTVDLIRRMEMELSLHPFLATGAKLADVLPPKNGVWSEQEKNSFKDLIENRTLSLEHVLYEDYLMSVRLRQPKSGGMDLAQYLINKNLAKALAKKLQFSDELDPIVPGTRVSTADNSPYGRRTNLPYIGAIPKQQLAASPVPEPTVRIPNISVHQSIKSSPIRITSSPPLINRAPVVAPTSIPAPVAVPTSVPAAVAPLAVMTNQNSMSNSVIDKVATKSSVRFTVNVAFDSGYCVGSLISQPKDLAVFEFNLYALSVEAPADFRPSVGSVVAALSPEHNEWFRAYIIAVNQNAYSVVYVDFGNFEDGVVSVKPILANYKQNEIAVKLSVIEDYTSSIGLHLLLNTNHLLEIVAKEDKFVVAKFLDVNVPSCRIKLESWTSLVKQSIPCRVQRTIEGRRCDPGFTGEVVPVVIEDVDHIYVLFYDDLKSEMTKKIQTEIGAKSSSCSVLTCPPAVGSNVLALLAEDGDFYRAEVVNIRGESICVHYVDFGNSATVTLKDLKTLPEDMFKYPACATRVALSGVSLPAGCLPDNIKTCLEDCINQQFTIFILPSPDASVMQCILSKSGEILNDTILELIEFNQQCNNNEEIAATQISESMSKVVVDNAIVPDEVPLVGDVCVSHEMPQLITKAFSEGEVSVDNTLGKFFWDQGVFLDLPEEGEFQALILSSNHPQCLTLCAFDETILSKLDQLKVNMSRYSEEILFGYTPVNGEICIVQSPKDGRWCRAAVLQPTDCNSVFLVFLVDYGEVLSIPVENMRRIPKRFVDCIPYIAHQAELNVCQGITKMDDKLRARVSALLPTNSRVSVRVVARSDVAYVVEIPSVSKVLREEGLVM